MLTVLHRDEHLIAVHKPPGLLVHRTGLDAHETRFALQLLRDQIGAAVYPVHRLDKATSGILLFALSSEIAGRCRAAFEAGGVAKRYLAVVRGHPCEWGTVDHPLDREDHAGQAAGLRQPALTDYRRLATVELPVAVDRYPTSRYALVELVPHTGRRHQLRRHMKHIAHPIIGDTTHGHGAHNRMFRERFGCSRLLLVAVGMCLRHPSTDLPLAIETHPDEDFLQVTGAAGLLPRSAIWKAHSAAIP
ncbi:MAG: pseudouridine synthase [Steroidobacteraceae bacterium]